MLDGRLKRQLDPVLDRIGVTLARSGITANGLTLAGLVIGVAAAAAIVAGQLWLAAALIIASRLCDGLDGAVARATTRTDFGGFLDIVLDFAFYGLIPFAFVVADPAANGLAGGLLILSFYVNGASFLAFAILAEKRGLSTQSHGKKSLYFTTGLAEAGETIAVFLAFCLWPDAFSWIATAFAIICFYTALSRLLQARAVFT